MTFNHPDNIIIDRFQEEIRKVITDMIQDEFAALRIKTEKLHFSDDKS